jgi:polysaccharide export outer membrane protein
MTQKMITKFRFVCLWIAFGLVLYFCLLAGCATNQNVGQNLPPAELKQDEIAEINEQLFASARMHTDPSDYLLGSGDLLQVKVFEAEDLNTTVRISSRGNVTLPLLGAVSIKDLSAREAEEKIENLYRARYIKDPHVSIFVEEHFSRRVTLMGEFRNPGTYDYLSKQRLLDVMALGGGLSDKAGRVVQIRRYGGSAEGMYCSCRRPAPSLWMVRSAGPVPITSSTKPPYRKHSWRQAAWRLTLIRKMQS